MNRRVRHIAKVRCNSAGEWHLLVSGTDMCELLYRYRHPDQEEFPGAAIRARLVDLGWAPDGRASLVSATESAAQMMLRNMMCGWVRSKDPGMVWKLPVYRETR